MGARELLADLTGAGLTVTPEGDRLVIRPASRLTDELRAAVREAKPELLRLLTEAAPAPPPCDPPIVARLIRWGWPHAEAQAQAERLRDRDEHADFRHLCIECQHFRPGRCGNHKAADLSTPEVGRDLAAIFQDCPGFALATCLIRAGA
jgi:virulence-associated protein VagC